MAIDIFADYHTHTTFSHGVSTVEQNVLAAISKGLSQIAICDHSHGHVLYGVKDYNKYFNEIERVKRAYADKIKVMSALEVNLSSFDGLLDINDETAKKCELLIFGYHRMIAHRTLDSFAYFTAFGVINSSNIEKNTRAYIEALNKNKIFAVAHPHYGIRLDMHMLAPVLKRTGTAIEINSSHNLLNIEETRMLRAEGVKFILSSDAHDCVNVGNFSSAVAFCELAGLDSSDIINAR